MKTELDRRGKRRTGAGLLLFCMASVLALPRASFAHVKWFSEFSYSDRPNEFEQLLSPTFFWLALLSMSVIAAMVLLEQWMDKFTFMKLLDRWLSDKSKHSLAIIRLGMGATLLWSWQAGKILAPDLSTDSEAVLWLEFVTAFFLIFRQTVPLAGLGVLALYGIAIAKFGFFYMLDYLMYGGIAYFMIVSVWGNESFRRTALPAVYATVGFCLIWLGIEKLVYPSWAIFLLEKHPVLALGFDHEFFVMGAAFVEISLGFMIMACLQQRLLALTITLVFFLTTMVFGRQEVVGHTMIHAVLIIFLIAGAGKAVPPMEWLPKRGFYAPFAAVGFAVFLGTLMVPYVRGAKLRHQTMALNAKNADPTKMSHDQMHKILLEVGDAPAGPPQLAIAIHRDTVAGWNLELVTENFQFTPQAAGLKNENGKGHAHLHINGKKSARVYSPWFHIGELPPGNHKIEVTLNANNHATFAVKGKPVKAVTEIEVVPEKERMCGE